MKLLTLILVLTFVFGVLRLLTFTKIFDVQLAGILESIFPVANANKTWKGFFRWVDSITFYYSLCFQVWYWIFLY